MAVATAAGMTGPLHGPAAGGAPKQLVIMCHGISASGAQLIRYAPHAAAALPEALFLAPDGPEACPWGGRQWFSLRDMRPEILQQGLSKAAAALDVFIDEALARHALPANAYALVGFSQGAMTALYAGLRRRTAPFGVAAVAGALFGQGNLEAEKRNDGPVLLAHGEDDERIPAARSREAAAALARLGVAVETLFVPGLGHNINDTVLDRVAGFLQAHAPA